MAQKAAKRCSHCETKYTVVWNIEEQDLHPLTCPFCGFEVDNEEDEIETAEEDEDDSWD